MRYQFNDFILDAERFELSTNGEPLHTEPQVIELLLLLVQNHERMVSKEEINEKIWRGRVVSEAALSSRIKLLRQLLGDSGKAQTIIRTVHKKGFRFVAPVAVTAPNRKDYTAGEAPPSSETTLDSTHKPSHPVIAVLPFTNLSADAEQEYFSDGITADIMTHLSKHRWLNVIARNSTFGYKGKSVDVRKLGNELGANYVVEGSVQRGGTRVRVTVHLIDTQSGHQIWGERYDREIADIFSVQDEITAVIAARLEPEIGLAERQRIVHARPTNLQAWDCYHLGIYHFFKFTNEDNLEAQRLLKRSQELDPQFGEAYAWWAYAIVLGMVYWNTKPTQDSLDQALQACDTALSLDRHNATFYALRARVLLARQEYQNAITDNKIAIELNPTFAAAYCGLGDSLAYEGSYERSIDCFEKAIALSPNDPQLWAFLTYGALAFIFKQEYARALAWLERAASLPNCQYWTTAHKIVALVYLNRFDDATRELQKLMAQEPRFSREYAREKLFYLKDPKQVDMYLQGLQKIGMR